MADERTPRTRQARTSSGEPAAAGLARELSELARDFQASDDPVRLQQRIVDAALTEIEAASAAGIMLATPISIATTAHTDDVVLAVDRAQLQAGDGPCLTALREEVTARSNDLASETRWPNFARAATALGVRSMLSFQLFVEDDNLGALNLYATVPNAFTDADESVGLLLASHAAIAIAGSRAETNLQRALQNRDVIGQAKGILMERLKLDDRDAFDLLVRISQRTHRKLREVADALTLTGALPDDTTRETRETG